VVVVVNFEGRGKGRACCAVGLLFPLFLCLDQPLVVVQNLVGEGLILGDKGLDLVLLLVELVNELDSCTHRILVCDCWVSAPHPKKGWVWDPKRGHILEI